MHISSLLLLSAERQRLVQDQTDHQDLVAIFDDEMTAREDAALTSEIQLGKTSNQLRTKAESVANGMAASAVMRRALLSGMFVAHVCRSIMMKCTE